MGKRIQALGLGAAPLLLPLAALSQTAEIQLAEDVVVVPMSHASRHVAVTVEIGGRPWNFQVDTYASIDACVDDDVAEALGFEKIGRIRNSDGRNKRERDLVRIDEITLGGVTLTNVRTLVDDYDWVADGESEKVHGLLGFGAFRDVLLTFDYPKSRLVLRRGSLDPQGPHTIPFEATNGAPNVLFKIGDEDVKLGIDTGAGMALSLMLEDSVRFPLHGKPRKVGRGRSVYTEFDIHAGLLAVPVRFAGHEREPVSALFSGGASRRLVGYDLLRAFAVTFDSKAALVRFERPPAPAPVPLSDAALERWAGTYETGKERFVIARRDRELLLQKDGEPPRATIAVAEDELVLRHVPVRLRLSSDRRGRSVVSVEEHPDRPAVTARRVE